MKRNEVKIKPNVSRSNMKTNSKRKQRIFPLHDAFFGDSSLFSSCVEARNRRIKAKHPRATAAQKEKNLALACANAPIPDASSQSKCTVIKRKKKMPGHRSLLVIFQTFHFIATLMISKLGSWRTSFLFQLDSSLFGNF